MPRSTCSECFHGLVSCSHIAIDERNIAAMLAPSLCRRLAARPSAISKMPLRAKILDPAMVGQSSRHVRTSPSSEAISSLTDPSLHSTPLLRPKPSKSCLETIRMMCTSALNMACERSRSTVRRNSTPWMAACVGRSFRDCRNGTSRRWRTS